MASHTTRDNEEGEAPLRDVGRAQWSKETVYIFCDLCIQHAERSKGKRGATTSQRMPWKVLEVEFTKRTNLAYDKNQLKNKWDWLRNRWSLWKALKGKETGLGWDHEKGTISASEEWWKNKIEENMHFRPFQYEGIEPELEYKLEQLFGGSVAQGGMKFTPVQRHKESVYIPVVSPPNLGSVDSIRADYEDVMSENGGFNLNQTNIRLCKIPDPAFKIIDEDPTFIPPEASRQSDCTSIQEAQSLSTNEMSKVCDEITTSLMRSRRVWRTS